MSTEQNQMADSNVNKPRVLTGFIYYNENDDLSKIFEVIKDFRTRHGLKFSHYKGYIFFMMSSEYIDEFGKVRPFKISKFKSSSEYTCTKDVADKLMGQRNSFIRVNWDENGHLTFRSRTKGFFHNHLVRKLFKDADIEFDNDSYTIHRYNPENGDEEKDTQATRQVQATPAPQSADTTGFVKVERKRIVKTPSEDKPRTDKPRTAKPRVQKESEEVEAPKIRGKRATKTK